MDVHEYLGVLRRGVVFIVLGVLLGLLGGAAVQSMEGLSYSATSRDLVTNKTSGDLDDWLQASNFTQGRIASYVLVASSSPRVHRARSPSASPRPSLNPELNPQQP